MVFTVASDIKNQGLVERIPDSGIWWIRWTDHAGRRHLEKVGRRGDAVALLAKRRRETLLRRKAPEYLNGRTATFGDLAIDALTHSRETNGERSTAELQLKLRIIGERFNSVSADEITRSGIQQWLLEEGRRARLVACDPKSLPLRRSHWSSVVAVENGKLDSQPCCPNQAEA
jgi:hypothetical protein